MSFLDKLFGNTSSFKPAEGINFKSPEISINELVQLTNTIYEFISADYDDKFFWLYDDWLEFDGTHFPRRKIDINELKRLLTNSKQIFDSRRSDFLVYTGISPINHLWYLRYNIEAENDEKPVCTIDISIPYVDAERFKDVVMETNSHINFHQSDSTEYFNGITKESSK